MTDPTPAAPPCPLWAKLIATGFGVGYLKPAPGTWGSLAAALILAAIFRPWSPEGGWVIYSAWRNPLIVGLLLSGVYTALGVPAATRFARASGILDPSRVVIDEFAGQTLAYTGLISWALFDWRAWGAGFLLFRLFDIWKPWPIRKLEHFPGGWGIMADDLAAGALAAICLALLLRFHLLPGA